MTSSPSPQDTPKDPSEDQHKNTEIMVMVPGHAVYMGRDATQARLSEHWKGTFPGYQDNDEAELYWEHIRTGVLTTARSKKIDGLPRESLLIFSGGETRTAAGPYAEAQSYWFLAHQHNWFGQIQMEKFATTEEFARDSFENLLFSIHRFKQVTRRLPTQVIVCGFSFKHERYEFHWKTIMQHLQHSGVQLHDLKADFFYIDVNDPPPYLLQGPGGSLSGETETLSLFRADPLAQNPPLLTKEEERDRTHRHHPYPVSRK